MSGLFRAFLVTVALCGLTASTGATSASADSGQLSFSLAGPVAKQLKRQGVKTSAGKGGVFKLPVRKATYAHGVGQAVHRGSIRLRVGKKVLRLNSVRTEVGVKSRVTANLGGKRIVFLNIAAGKAKRQAGFTGLTIRRSPASLSPVAARQIGRRLGISLKPKRAGATVLKAVIRVKGVEVRSGSLDWGFDQSVRELFPAYDPEVATSFNTSHPEDHMRAYLQGTSLNSDDTFSFPVIGGTFNPGTGEAVVESRGWLRLGYCIGAFKAEVQTGLSGQRTACPTDDGAAHGIWLNMSGLTLKINGNKGTFEGLTDGGFHGRPPVSRQVRSFGRLDLSSAAPDLSVAGKVTWKGIRVFLTDDGGPLGLGLPAYVPGYELDPIDLTLTVGE